MPGPGVEQTSFDLACGLFVVDQFRELLHAIRPTHADLSRFRIFLINSVIATELGDKGSNIAERTRTEQQEVHHYILALLSSSKYFTKTNFHCLSTIKDRQSSLCFSANHNKSVPNFFRGHT